MAISLKDIARGGSDRAPIIVIHGQPGAGKTTFAAGSDNPVFIKTEDGLGLLNVDSFPEAESIADVMGSLEALYEDGHDFKTVVIDSLSALEPMIWQQVAKDHGADSIESFGFGKGYIYAMDYWRDLVAACKGLSKKGITPILIAHSEVVRFDAPDLEPYDRYQIKLHKRAFAHLYEQADIIGFADESVYVSKGSAKDEKGKAKPKGDRKLRLADSPAAIVKNRYSMPASIPLEWSEFAKHIPFFNKL